VTAPAAYETQPQSLVATNLILLNCNQGAFHPVPRLTSTAGSPTRGLRAAFIIRQFFFLRQFFLLLIKSQGPRVTSIQTLVPSLAKRLSMKLSTHFLHITFELSLYSLNPIHILFRFFQLSRNLALYVDNLYSERKE
jgi:hypothetical protein